MEQSLISKIRYFLSTSHRRRSEIAETLTMLRQLGDVFIVGGLLRDLALFGNRPFRSDIDLVIRANDLEHYKTFVHQKAGVRNRFGGFAIPSKKWRIDIWEISNTWAHVAGHFEVKSPHDIIHTTFFDCDAIIYDINMRHLRYKDGYFSRIHQRSLDINLLPNPNPLGNVVRAFRYAILKDMRWSPALTRYVADAIALNGWVELENQERRSHNTSYVSIIDQEALSVAIDIHIHTRPNNYFTPAMYLRKRQLSLGFNCDSQNI